MIRFENNDYLLDLTIAQHVKFYILERYSTLCLYLERKLFLRMLLLTVLQLHYAPQLYIDARSIEVYKNLTQKYLHTEKPRQLPLALHDAKKHMEYSKHLCK